MNHVIYDVPFLQERVLEVTNDRKGGQRAPFDVQETRLETSGNQEVSVRSLKGSFL